MDKGPARRSRAASRGVINSNSGNSTAPPQPPEPIEEPAVIEPPEVASVPTPEPEPPRRDTPPAQPITKPPKQAESRTMRAPRKRRIILPVVIVIIVIAAAIVGLFIWRNNTPSPDTGIDSSKYQAVFLTNGQVYFGKLKIFNAGYMQLTDIWYLQTQSSDASSTNPQSTSSDTKNVLVKLGNEVHGPEDQMIITKDQILFYENLKSDGTVSQTISKAQK
jgi:hypothetical protein